ncbi:hypothetical protein LCGC14_0745120 [marine sediment metagenome]|uniref:Uncharacterized protein n=1 Tax=marine sediment metagenome TaxID=412755 RepID=A0A0F9TCV3_9ZZZZ
MNYYCRLYIILAKNIFNISADVFVDKYRIRSSEMPLLIGRNDKIVKNLGRRPVRSIGDIIREYVKYFQDHPEHLGIETH